MASGSAGVLLLRDLLHVVLLPAQPHAGGAGAAARRAAARPRPRRAAVVADPDAELRALALVLVIEPAAPAGEEDARRRALGPVRALHRLRGGARTVPVPRPRGEAARGDLRRGRRGSASRPERL